MKKASKILTLILVFVLLAGVFSGCAMFTRNAGRYRSLVAVTVGEEEITVGKILDTFNNYYNTYGSYISQGYITSEYVLQMAMQSVVTQAMKVNEYISTHKAEADNTTFKDFCHNAQYLTAEEIEFCIKYVKYLTFQTFDSSVLAQISAKRTIEDEEQEDTSRDFRKDDDLEGYSYSEYTYRQRVFNKTADEYFNKYYEGITIEINSSVSEYVYKDAAAAKTMLDNLNGRRAEDDAEITFEEYKTAQETVIKQYQRSVKNSYYVDFEQFMKNQVADMVASTIAAKYDYSVNQALDGEKLDETIAQLNNNLQVNTASQAAGFALKDNFVDFIEGLTDTSYIYNVPDNYKYIYVKNILIPFTEQQKATLSNLLKDVGNDTENAAYIALRNKYASEVIADDFNSDKVDDKYGKVEKLFATNEGKLTLNYTDPQDVELSQIFAADGTVNKGEYDSADEAVIAMMKRYNTDTAQHSSLYDYVVRVGDVPANYTAKWVTEFVDAASEAYKHGVGSYALAISTYGVHIVYYADDVKAQEITFTADRITDTSLPEYRLFSAYFSQQSSRMLQENLEELQKSYLKDNKIAASKNFDRFLKDNGFKFDLIEFLTDED